MKSKPRVVVGMSGGVDSSLAASILVEQGYEVIGLFMRNWNDDSVILENECPWIDDANDAMAIAAQLGIAFQVVDLSAQYKTRIVDYMLREYEAGRTPNPDILCNREIKFDLFLQLALEMKADFIATGHYVRKEITKVNGQEIYHLLVGIDQNKDQSYFLCQLDQAQLSKALFPIGQLTKSQVRAEAAARNLLTAGKKDSQGLCFIGKVKLPVFLQQQLNPKEGKVILVNSEDAIYDLPKETLSEISQPYDYNLAKGKIIGTHNGAHFYTIGQRKGLGIGGFQEPLFILEKNTEKNLIFVGSSELHRGLYRHGLKIMPQDIHWVNESKKLNIGQGRDYLVRIRYRQELVPANLSMREEGLYMIFESPMKAIAQGQFAVWYEGEELIGSGVIS
ncbi:MAG: tRNA 2-thiouridine(34) synthase MnmA [Chitinophagales bacterium]|jgi:tRNA-specific 2-thiouridylase|nr:tRNA 2-thiouridine(34) synthase MnmA [Chitinophagales bacterium]